MDEAGRDRALGAVGEHLSRAVKVVPTAQGKVDASVLLGLGLSVEDDIENRKTHHDDELDHEHDDLRFLHRRAAGRREPRRPRSARRPRRRGRERAAHEGLHRRRRKPMRLLLQAVGSRVTHHYDRAWTPADDRRSRLVVIGLRGLDRPAIEKIWWVTTLR